MKKELLLLIVMLVSINISAQTYTLTRNLPIAEIAGIGTAITALGDDNVTSALPIGFDFNFYGISYTQFYLGANGLLSFGPASKGRTSIPNSSLYNSICFANSDLHCGRGTPTINYFTTGIAPNRILVINFKNVQHYSNSGNLTSAQIQLYEGSTGKIELHILDISSGYSRTIGIQANNLTDYLTESTLNGNSNLSISNEMIRFQATPTCSNTLNLTSSANSLCPGTNLLLTATASPSSNVSYEWYLNNNLINNANQATYAAAEAGAYKVKINDALASCSKTSTQLNISNSFSPYLSGGNYKCNTMYAYPSGNGYSFKWFKNNVQIANQTSNSITLPDTGTYFSKVTYNGCEISTPTQHIDSNVISLQPYSTFCGLTYISNNSSSYNNSNSYSWSGPNGFASNIASPTISSTSNSSINGVYSVVVNFGCESKSKTVNVLVPTPSINTISTGTPYKCGNIYFSSSSTSSTNKTYSWTGPNGFTSALSNPVIPFTTTHNNGIYTLVINFGCSTTASSTVSVAINENVDKYVYGNSGYLCGNTSLSSTIYTSANPTISYSWIGPNGFTSTQKDPIITNLVSSNSGIYTLSAAIAQCSATVTGTASVSVNNPYVVINSSAIKVCEGTNLTINTTSNGGGVIPAFQWTGPNNFTSTLEDPVINNITQIHAGKYKVQATFGNNCFIAKDSVEISVGAPSVSASNSFNSNIIYGNCPGETGNLYVSYYGNLSPTYSWSGPNGYSGSGYNPNLTLNANSAGTYTVTANFGACGTSTATTSIILGPPSSYISSSFRNDYNCPGTTGSLSFNPYRNIVATYQWSGPGGFTSTNQNPNLTLSSTSGGVYTITANYGTCGTSTAATSILVGPPSISAGNSSQSFLCPTASNQLLARINESDNTLPSSPTIASFSWSGPNAFSSTSRNPVLSNLTTAASGFYTLSVTLTNGCTGTYTSKVAVNVSTDPNPSSSQYYNGYGCTDDSTTINASHSTLGNTIATYNWTGPNSFNSSLQSPKIKYADGGVYTLVNTFSGGCTGTYTSYITVLPNSKPSLYTPTVSSFCEGQNLYLPNISSNSNLTYNWTGPNAFISNLNNPLITNSASSNLAGIYSVSITTPNCLEAYTSTVSLVLNPSCVGNACSFSSFVSGSSTICLGQNVQLYTQSTGNIQNLSWTGPNGFSSSSNPNTSQTSTTIPNIQSSGTYTATAIISSGNCIGTYTSTVYVNVISNPPQPSLSLYSGLTCEKSSLSINIGVNNGGAIKNYKIEGPNSFKYYYSFNDPGSSSSSVYRFNSNASMAGQYTITADLYANCNSVPIPATSTISITVNPKPVPPAVFGNPNSIELGQTATISGTGCSTVNDIKWNYGLIGSPNIVSPKKTIDYWAYCQSNNGCSSLSSNRVSIVVNSCATSLSLSNLNTIDNFSTGNVLKQANQSTGTIMANNFITGSAKVIYQAKNIQLSPGFVAENGTVFQAEMGGCD